MRWLIQDKLTDEQIQAINDIVAYMNLVPNTDAFARLRISSPETIFDSKQLGDKQPLFWDDQVISGDGVAPTSNSDLYDKLVTLIS